MWLIALPAVLLGVVGTLFMGLIVFVPLNRAELDLSATVASWSAVGFVVWLVIGILMYKHMEAEYP